MACELCCCLLPQCEALRICRSGFPIATVQYDTGFIIALVVDEKFLDVESHWLMLINWQNTSPSHVLRLRNPTFIVISTTERLFSKHLTTGGGNDFLEFLVQPRWTWLDLLASISRDVVLTKKVWERIKYSHFEGV